MKERPILFSAPMVRALIAGTKTQTRRICKAHVHEAGASYRDSDGWPLDGALRIRCPYGVPGDRLWVKETWRTTGDGGRIDDWPPSRMQAHQVWYDADGHAPADECTGKTRVSIHMPRWASRIDLEVTSVRVERLQAIGKGDAIDEGIEKRGPGWAWYDDLGSFTKDPLTSYRSLWESINGIDSWHANPWVWVIEFKRVTRGKKA